MYFCLFLFFFGGGLLDRNALIVLCKVQTYSQPAVWTPVPTAARSFSVRSDGHVLLFSASLTAFKSFCVHVWGPEGQQGQ